MGWEEEEGERGQGEESIPFRAAGIRAHNDSTRDIEIRPDPAQSAGLGVEVVDGDVEEALDLAGVQVHGDDVVTPGRLEHVGHELCGDGCARLVLFVLPRVGKVGDDGGDATCRGSLAGGDYDEELHDVVVDVAGGGGLEDED